MEHKPVYYSEYLQLDKILNAQNPVSNEQPHINAHDEMLFIVIHQAYELWFKQILFEVQSVIDIMEKPAINDNSADLQLVVHRLRRVITILNVLVQQIDIMESMTPMDFLEFRDMLRPASGFQSTQFKILEAKLGLQFENRHGQEYYISQLKPDDVETIKKAESGSALLPLLNKWLERMPFLSEPDFWEKTNLTDKHTFWAAYENIYAASLGEGEKNNLQSFKEFFFENRPEKTLSSAASRSALFIMLYRGYPMLELPFQLLDCLLEIDNELGNWRSRHMNMVRRMIGTRTGTGGSTGAGYLKGAMDKHFIFRELAQLNSFLINRSKLPVLPKKLVEKLGF